MTLRGRVAIITGASRGIGRAIARLFAAEGASVVVNYMSQAAQAELLVAEIFAAEGRALAIQADISNGRAVQSMVDRTAETFGGVDILVNNAGVLIAKGTLLAYSEDEFDRMWAVNVKGTLNCTRSVASLMMAKRSGRIVNITSLAAFGTTKAAIVSITKCCAAELGSHGVNVNAIAPGLTRTDMGMTAPVSESQRDYSYFEQHSMLGRIGEPQDVAAAALFLASDAASFITGQVITVDGGRKDFLSHSA
jgi:3-oxoacyl-[acyl-carrier protein] reductase